MGAGSTDTTQRSEPLPEQYKRLRESIYPEADRLFRRELEFFPESTVGQRDPLSGQARQLTEGLGRGGIKDDANAFLGNVLGGGFMGGRGQNPELDNRFQLMSDRISEQYQRITAPGTASRFAAAGRSGSGAHNAAVNLNEKNLGRALGETATNVYYGDYENRMRDRMQGLGLAPGVRGLEYGDLAATQGQAGIEENYLQRLVNDQINRFNFNQQEPESRLDRYQGRIISPQGMGTVTGTTPTGGNAGLSAGLGAAGLLMQLIPGVGTAAGAGLAAAGGLAGAGAFA